MIIIGIDPHKTSLTAVAVDCSGESVARRQFRYCHATAEMVTQMGRAAFRGRRRQGIGAGIAQILLADAEHVVDVPSTLAMRVRVLDTGGGGKTDADDARLSH